MFITLRLTFRLGEKSLGTNLMSTGWKVSTHSLSPRTRPPAVAQESQDGRKPGNLLLKKRRQDSENQANKMRWAWDEMCVWPVKSLEVKWLVHIIRTSRLWETIKAAAL